MLAAWNFETPRFLGGGVSARHVGGWIGFLDPAPAADAPRKASNLGDQPSQPSQHASAASWPDQPQPSVTQTSFSPSFSTASQQASQPGSQSNAVAEGEGLWGGGGGGGGAGLGSAKLG